MTSMFKLGGERERLGRASDKVGLSSRASIRDGGLIPIGLGTFKILLNRIAVSKNLFNSTGVEFQRLAVS